MRESRKTRSTEETQFPSNDVNRHVKEIACKKRGDYSGITKYRCRIENANGVQTVEGNIGTVEMEEAPESFVDEDKFGYFGLDHECKVIRDTGGNDIIKCRPRDRDGHYEEP